MEDNTFIRPFYKCYGSPVKPVKPVNPVNPFNPLACESPIDPFHPVTLIKPFRLLDPSAIKYCLRQTAPARLDHIDATIISMQPPYYNDAPGT